MRLAFWRREPEPFEWYHIDRSAPYAMAAEMETWPEPIDVIREALGLPLRWRVAIGRGWHSVWSAITYDPTLALFQSSGALLESTYRASAGMLPIHYEALENARQPRVR